MRQMQFDERFLNRKSGNGSWGTVASTTIAEVRAMGFDILEDPTALFPNHARLVHPLGLIGFRDDWLNLLQTVFVERKGC